jgi:hypothetical protein
MTDAWCEPPTTGATSAHEFRDDDAGYRAWLAGHPDGFVINITRSHNASEACLHHAHCRTINGPIPRGLTWTGPYVKVCAQRLPALQQWTSDNVRAPIPPCGICHPDRAAARSSTTKRTGRTFAAQSPALEGRSTIQGPAANNPVVEAWSDDYIRFERLPDWQKRLRGEIKARCGRLQPSAGQVLHATYFGTKHPNADVENVLLYYIDSFRAAGRNGISFEHGATAPSAPDGVEYSFGYRYALAARSGGFTAWQQGRTLASFDWTDLGAFAAVKRPAQVWLALTRGEATVSDPVAAPDTPFGVRIQIRPPRKCDHVVGSELVKEILDGVVCAFQAHTDTSVLPEVVARLATVLPADPEEIEALLLDQRRAVLGVVQRLVYPYRKGVKWDPADHLCVAGELLPAEPVGERWAIKGELVELSRGRGTRIGHVPRFDDR